MIRGRIDGPEAVLGTTFAAGHVSFVDRDWVTDVETDVPSLSFAEDGEVLWCGAPLGQLPAGADPTTVAAGALLRVAREAAAAVGTSVRGQVDVVGEGLVAAQVRRLVASGAAGSDERAGAVVEATGEPESIRASLERVADLGAVVLVGEPGGRRLDLDLYATVHKRGLVLAGVAPPLHGIDVADAAVDVEDRDLEYARDALVDASPQARASSDSLWYRIAS